MKKPIYKWQFAGFIVTSILGVLFHFLFEWSGKNVLVVPFYSVNESIWEHLKLIFFPMFIFSFVQSRYVGKEYKNFWCIKLWGMVFGIMLILELYYTINGAVGRTPDWVNIGIFFVAVALSFLLETRRFEKGSKKCKSSMIALVILWLLALVFVIFTFVTPQIPLFQDPVTGSYGL